MVPLKSHPERLSPWTPHQQELCLGKGVGDAEASSPVEWTPGSPMGSEAASEGAGGASLRAGHTRGWQLLITGLMARSLTLLDSSEVPLPPGSAPGPVQLTILLWVRKSKIRRIKLSLYPQEPHLYQMTQSLCLELFIKGAFVRSWDRKQALGASHQEAGQKVLSKRTFG